MKVVLITGGAGTIGRAFIKKYYNDYIFHNISRNEGSQVDLKRTYRFKHSNKEWSGIPIIASNMDGVGELNVAKILAKYNIITALTKQHDLNIINELSRLFINAPFTKGRNHFRIIINHLFSI